MGKVRRKIKPCHRCGSVGRVLEQLPTAQRWMPVTEGLPKELEPVNITWVNHEPEPYYQSIKDKPFTATGVYFYGQWYWWSTLCTDMLAEYGRNHSDRVDEHIEIIAWKPLPEPYVPTQSNDSKALEALDALEGKGEKNE